MERKRTQLRLVLFVMLVVGMEAFIALARAQGVAVDGARKPIAVPTVPHATPRSVEMGLSMIDLFPESKRIETGPLDVGTLLDEDARAGFGPLRMGVVQSFEPTAGDDGKWTRMPDGGWLWTASFRAAGAQAIRLRIEPWEPAHGSELIIFNPGRPAESLGPFGRGGPAPSAEFWTPTIYSDEVNVEYYVPAGIDLGAPTAPIRIAALLNQYRTPTPPVPDELNCHLDVSCYPAWQAEADGVGALAFINSPYGFFCSGGMLNRSPTDFTSLFMTADHCGVNVTNGASAIVTWFFQSDSCGGGPPNLFNLPQTTGITALVNHGASDYTLLGLSDNAPGGLSYLGWDSNPTWTNGGLAIAIHHPWGTYKRITIGNNLGASSCGWAEGPQTWLLGWPDGAGEIEPGSSGSPVFDANHRVRGTGTCGPTNCNEASASRYGQFAAAYSLLQPYLVPTDPIFVANWNMGFEDGTSGQPFNRVIEGAFAVIRGSNVYISPGSYNERFTIDKAMTLNPLLGNIVIGQ